MTVSGIKPARVDRITGEDGTIVFYSHGDWTVNSLQEAVKSLAVYASAIQKTPIQWDVSGVGRIDSAGIVLIFEYCDLLQARDCVIEITGQKPEFQEMYELLRPLVSGQAEEKTPSFSRWLLPLRNLGESVTNFWHDILAFLSFIGENFIALMLIVRYPSSIRFAAIIKNIEEAGVRALPIITLTSFLIGVVIAYQGAVQLQKFGANVFIVDMIGISITRELAPLITAIVVAGRTGSSYTAQLGTMKITEEIDAMRIMGFEPHRFLVLPRIIALMISLPLMIFFADIIGITGGMIVSNIHLNISYPEFINRLQNVLEIKHVWIGLLKGPFFAWLIAITGCFRGLQVSRNTESIGRYTTISVVNAIFLVIACDALFSVVLTELGI
jgi:phospholipid/cholesterol/gamma-HCH transport system permease protein